MDTREIYKQKYLARIHEWTARLDALRARAEQMGAQARLDAKPRIDAMHAGLEAARTKAHDIATATDDRWEEVKAGIEHTWTETTAAIQGAYDAVLALERETMGQHEPTEARKPAQAAKTPKKARTSKSHRPRPM